MEEELLKLILQELREIKGSLTRLEEKVDKLEKRVGKLEEKVDKLEKRVDKLEEKVGDLEGKVDVNSENIEAIKNIVTGHYKEFKEYARYNSVQHNLYDAKLLSLEEESDKYNSEEQ